MPASAPGVTQPDRTWPRSRGAPPSGGRPREELHLSIETVEPIVSMIFTTVNLRPDAGSNRRVLPSPLLPAEMVPRGHGHADTA